LKKLAGKFNLTYEAFGVLVSSKDLPAAGTLSLTDNWGTLEPAPVTPTGEDVAAFQLLSGTIKATFNSHRVLEGTDDLDIVVSPGIMSGNTGELSLLDSWLRRLLIAGLRICIRYATLLVLDEAYLPIQPSPPERRFRGNPHR
jgi:hypothetical protein